MTADAMNPGCKHLHCFCLDCREPIELKESKEKNEKSIRQDEQLGVATALLLALREALYGIEKEHGVPRDVRIRIYRYVWITAVNSKYINKFDLEFRDDSNAFDRVQ
jgi:ATP-dependent RNA circularization protein (DNA/RNA ligase family)